LQAHFKITSLPDKNAPRLEIYLEFLNFIPTVVRQFKKDCRMKKFISVFALSLSLNVFSSVKIEEELYVMDQKPEVLKDLIRMGSVEVDHVTSKGFEVYGPRGLKNILDERNIPFVDMISINKIAFMDYPTHEQITARLKKAVAKRPDIMQLFSIGKSVKGRELWVVKISDQVGLDEVEPEFKYISSMHGDEITGRELTTSLIEEIAEKYEKDAKLTELINNTEIYIMPSMNPDGSMAKRRANANGVDLNRNFPDITADSESKPNGREIENQAVMKFQAQRKFSLSANFHGGTIVANYPWDSKYELHPLDELVKELSLAYSELNPEMRSSTEFPGGITNGAQWYVVRGGMQDWSYFWHNDLQITLEVSHEKWPDYSEIPGFYKSNRDSMIEYMKRIHQGAGFKIVDENVSGEVTIRQTSPEVKEFGNFTFTRSEFYKVLPEGEYEFIVKVKGQEEKKIALGVDRIQGKKNGNYKLIHNRGDETQN